MQAQEENAHAMRLYDFLLARNCPVVLKEIVAPRCEYESIPEVFAMALKQEMQVSESIDRLYTLALKEGANAAMVELQWFVTEQVEEEKTARTIAAKFEMIKDDPSAMLDLDSGLAVRTEAEVQPNSRFMNYFAHGHRFIDRPYFLAGTALPDMLSAINRRVRIRRQVAQRFLNDCDPVVRDVAAGIACHHEDDAWFHGQRAFVELSSQFTVELRGAWKTQRDCERDSWDMSWWS